MSMLKECISNGRILVSKVDLPSVPSYLQLIVFHMFISCLPSAVFWDRTWVLICNSFFYVSTHHILILNLVLLSSYDRICFLLFPEGIRNLRIKTPSVNHGLVNLANSGRFYKGFAKLCPDAGKSCSCEQFSITWAFFSTHKILLGKSQKQCKTVTHFKGQAVT